MLYTAIARIVSHRRGKALFAFNVGLQSVQAHYQPDTHEGRLTDPEWGLIEIEHNIDADVKALEGVDFFILPQSTEQLSTLPTSRRLELKNRLDAIAGLSYTYRHGTVTAMPTADIASITGQTLLNRLKQYFQIPRPLPPSTLLETHNTEFSDDFTNLANWSADANIADGATATHDATNLEVDWTNAANQGALRFANSTGSINMEAQCTTVIRTGGDVSSGIVSRYRPAATTFYGCEIYDLGNTFEFFKFVNGTYTFIGNTAQAVVAGDWYTLRFATETNGAVADLKLWWQNHSTTKPAFPGWLKESTAPDITKTDSAPITDTDAQRAGIKCYNGANVATPASTDHFRERAISDRPSPSKTFNKAMFRPRYYTIKR